MSALQIFSSLEPDIDSTKQRISSCHTRSWSWWIWSKPMLASARQLGGIATINNRRKKKIPAQSSQPELGFQHILQRYMLSFLSRGKLHWTDVVRSCKPPRIIQLSSEQKLLLSKLETMPTNLPSVTYDFRANFQATKREKHQHRSRFQKTMFEHTVLICSRSPISKMLSSWVKK